MIIEHSRCATGSFGGDIVVKTSLFLAIISPPKDPVAHRECSMIIGQP
jgi:hypothetical protein